MIVANANRFTVTGRLAGATTTRPRVALATRGIRVRAASSATFHLVLSKRLHSRFAHAGRLTLRLRAAVRDPAGHTRTVLKTVTVRRAEGADDEVDVRRAAIAAGTVIMRRRTPGPVRSSR